MNELSGLVASRYWYHRIDLGAGIVTPGAHDSPAALASLDRLGLPKDCRGLRVLDVGCRDGFFSFAMEQRGATVIGIDYISTHVTGFALAAKALGSRVEYRTENVYDVDPTHYGRFDVVLFLGVLYHLRNPLLALDKLRAVTMTNGLFFAETAMIEDRSLAVHETPLWQYLEADSFNKDATNKWIPNTAGLRGALADAQFRCDEVEVLSTRLLARATAVEDMTAERFRLLDASANTRLSP